MLSVRLPATRNAHRTADHPPLNGHATQDRGLKTINLVPFSSAPAQSRVLLQRPIAHMEPFAPEAGQGYVARWPLNLDRPLIPGASPFVGGFEFWNFRVPPAGVLVALLQQHGRTAWRIRGNAGNGSRYFGLWLLPRSSFTIAADESIGLSRLTALSVNMAANNRGHFAIRFVVQSGGRFYLSRSATDRLGRFILTGTTLAEQRWAIYEPARDLRANVSPEGWTSSHSVLGGAALLPFETATSELSNVQAVGVYVEAVNRSATGDRCLEWHDLAATVVV